MKIKKVRHSEILIVQIAAKHKSNILLKKSNSSFIIILSISVTLLKNEKILIPLFAQSIPNKILYFIVRSKENLFVQIV